MPAFSPLRFKQYARDLSEAVYQMIDRDKLRRDYPGGLRTRVIGSNQFVTLGDKTVMVSQMATDEEIAAALHLNGEAAAVPATPLPPAPTIQQAFAVAPVRKPAAPGSFAASLRAMMDEARAGIAQARADGLAKVTDAVGKLTEAKVATAQVTSSMAKTIEDEAASVLAELGQISNMGPE
jgi:hypothetical protein